MAYRILLLFLGVCLFSMVYSGPHNYSPRGSNATPQQVTLPAGQNPRMPGFVSSGSTPANSSNGSQSSSGLGDASSTPIGASDFPDYCDVDSGILCYQCPVASDILSSGTYDTSTGYISYSTNGLAWYALSSDGMPSSLSFTYAKVSIDSDSIYVFAGCYYTYGDDGDTINFGLLEEDADGYYAPGGAFASSDVISDYENSWYESLDDQNYTCLEGVVDCAIPYDYNDRSTYCPTSDELESGNWSDDLYSDPDYDFQWQLVSISASQINNAQIEFSQVDDFGSFICYYDNVGTSDFTLSPTYDDEDVFVIDEYTFNQLIDENVTDWESIGEDSYVCLISNGDCPMPFASP